MSRRAAVALQPPADLYLRPNDLRFITEYLQNGNNGTQAWLTVHPNAKYTSAEVSAHRKLSTAKVRQEITRRTRAEQGITRPLIESDLLTARTWALERQNPLELASVSMDMAKLAGFLVEKREVTHVSSDEQRRIAQLVMAALTTTRSGTPCRITTVPTSTPATALQVVVPPLSDAGMVRSTVNDAHAQVAATVSAFNAACATPHPTEASEQLPLLPLSLPAQQKMEEA